MTTAVPTTTKTMTTMLTTTTDDDDNDDDEQSSCVYYVLEGWELVLKLTNRFDIIIFRHWFMGQSRTMIT